MLNRNDYCKTFLVAHIVVLLGFRESFGCVGYYVLDVIQLLAQYSSDSITASVRLQCKW